MSLLLFIIIVTFTFGLGFFLTHQSVQESHQLFPPTGEFIFIHEKKIHYLRKGKGPSVVLIHGAHGSIYDYKLSFMDQLATHYDVIAIDRPGFGYSERDLNEPMTLFDQANILHAFLEKLEIKNPILVGHSFGGALALAMERMSPKKFKGLLLISPYIVPYEGPAHPIHHIPVIPLVGRLLMETWFLPLAKIILADKFLEKVFSPQKTPKEYQQVIKVFALRPSNYRSNAQDIRLFGPALKQLKEKIAGFETQTIIFFGEKDPVASYPKHEQYVREHMPRSEFISLKDTGHQPMFFYGDEIMDAIHKLNGANG